MTANVRIIPSGHEFVSEGNSNLLEAGLRAGLRLGYGCSNGACGKCLATLVSGEVKKVRPHDYIIGRQERSAGQLLMCCNSAVTDVVLQAGEANSPCEIPDQQIRAKVKSVQVVNNSVALVHLRTPRTSRLRFLAGQRVRLGGNGMPAAITPVASCPCDDMHLHFQIPLRAGDDFSKHVLNTLKPGDSMEVNGPMGDFILDEDSTRPLIFIAQRTGFGPVRSLIEHAMSLETADAIHLVWAAEDKTHRFLDNLCRSWADSLDEFHYVPFDTAAKEDTIKVADGIALQLERTPGWLAGHDCYIAGTERFADACRNSMIARGLPSQQIFVENLAYS